MAPHDDARNLDAPKPPGGPLREDAPTADVTPGPQDTEPDPDPTVRPSGNPDGPQVVPAPPTPDGEPGPLHDDDLTPDLSGDLGTSSERTSPDGQTSGAAPTHPGETVPEVQPVEPGVPDGELEENPAEVPGHVSDPARNPGHSHS